MACEWATCGTSSALSTGNPVWTIVAGPTDKIPLSKTLDRCEKFRKTYKLKANKGFTNPLPSARAGFSRQFQKAGTGVRSCALLPSKHLLRPCEPNSHFFLIEGR